MEPKTAEISLESPPGPAAKAIHEGLIAHNRRTVDRPEPQSFSLVVRDGADVVGGVNAIVHWDVLFVEHVWLDEGQRGAGLGRALMARAEAEGRRLGAVRCILDTNDWQAPGFYAKLGYQRFGAYRYDAGRKACILLVKDLAA